MKPLLKSTAEWAALLLASPAALMCRLSMRMLGPAAGFTSWSQAVSLVPGLCGVYLRRAFYRLTLPQCDANACIMFGVVISHPTTRIGRSAYVGSYCLLGDVTLEDDVLIGSQVSIMNGNRQHGIERLDIPVREQPGEWPHVTIGRDSWIGERAVVQANVGRHCVIGAGAVVTKPIPDYAIAVGVPAKVIRYRQGAQRQAFADGEAASHEEAGGHALPNLKEAPAAEKRLG